jgi:lathosterol oxidase
LVFWVTSASNQCRRWKKTPLLRHVSTSSFHAGHHHEEGHNFGFYMLLWDRLCGTLAPRYEDDFARRPQ